MLSQQILVFEDKGILDVVYALEEIEGLVRIRISSIEPNLLHPEIIDLVASSKTLQPHFHMPLQSGSDTVLRLMKRRYDSKLYRQRVEYIRKQIPDACIFKILSPGFSVGFFSSL